MWRHICQLVVVSLLFVVFSFEMILARSISVKNVLLMCFLINNEVPVFSLTKDDRNSVKTIKLCEFWACYELLGLQVFVKQGKIFAISID
jgi:hypothetical protein